MKTDTLGIYIHIPFCKSKCRYCDFHSYAGVLHLQDAYIDRLCREIQTTGFLRRVDTIYIGGGTPTLLPPAQLVRILELLRDKYIITDDAEITVECNPATIDADGLRTLRQGGVNRLSIGLQSTDDAMLEKLGRAHTAADFETCYHAARQAGFDNISIDLMFGLPDQSMSIWTQTLHTVLSYGAEHLSCYSLKIEDGTPFASMPLHLPDDDTNRDMYDRCTAMLEEAGYQRYEISNFAKPGCASRHNMKYWQCDDFAGFGAGAYSCKNNIRYSNLPGLQSYMDAIDRYGAAPDTAVQLSKRERMSEFLFLGLRMCDGVSETEFEERFGLPLDDVYGGEICRHIMRGLMLRENGRLKLHPDMLYVSNSILVDFV